MKSDSSTTPTDTQVATVSNETLTDAAFELQEIGCHIGWTDEERESEYRAIADHLLNLKGATIEQSKKLEIPLFGWTFRISLSKEVNPERKNAPSVVKAITHTPTSSTETQENGIGVTTANGFIMGVHQMIKPTPHTTALNKVQDAKASLIASKMVPNRRRPYGTGWGPGHLEWPQKEGFEIRSEAERATKNAILRIARKQKHSAL